MRHFQPIVRQPAGRRPIVRSSLLLAAAVALAACASGGGGRAGAGDGPSDAVRTVHPAGEGRSSDLLTRDEIEQADAGTAYDAIARLRPAYLRTRSSGTTNSPRQFAIVYLDGANIGSIEALRRINARDVESVRYLRGPDATMRYGTGHEGGAILVTTKR